jgi:intracellular septation protein A
MHFLALLLQDQPNTNQMMSIFAALMAVYAVVIILALIVVIIPTWFICKKAGFSPWLSLIVIVPFGGLVLLYVLAFAEWKVVPAPQQGWTPLQPPPAQPTLPPTA